MQGKPPSRRVAVAEAVVCLALILAAASPGVFAQSTSSPSPPQRSPPTQTDSVSPPWFDSAGIRMTYEVTVPSAPSASPSPHSVTRGELKVYTEGLSPNGSLVVHADTNVSEPMVPNGTTYDDPLFPGVLPVLPEYMAAPTSFSVVARYYALLFKFRGEATVEVDGSEYAAYRYTVSTVIPGQTVQQPVLKLFTVIAKTGLIYNYTVFNGAYNVSATLILTSFNTTQAVAAQPSTLRLPGFAVPLNYVNYTVAGSTPESLKFESVGADSQGEFIFEKTAVVNGTLQNPVFFSDSYRHPLFYPAVTDFGSTVPFPVGLGTLEGAPLSYLGSARVNTPEGRFEAYAYANTTLGFEAYLDNSTGVAVYIETPPPGGFIELQSSNFVEPLPPGLNIPLIGSAAAAAVALILVAAYTLGRRTRGARSVRAAASSRRRRGG